METQFETFLMKKFITLHTQDTNPALQASILTVDHADTDLQYTRAIDVWWSAGSSPSGGLYVYVISSPYSILDKKTRK